MFVIPGKPRTPLLTLSPNRPARVGLTIASLVLCALVAACGGSPAKTAPHGAPHTAPSGSAAEQANPTAGPHTLPPSQLISITLTPTTPAGAGDLDSAARLIRQRAAQVGESNTEATVSGRGVVLTGPKSDEALLKALSTGGVLRLRHVLLEQVQGGGTDGDASLVRPGVLKLFREVSCESGAGDGAWKLQAGYAKSSDWDNPDAQVVSCDGSGTKYALDVAKILGKDVTNASAALSATYTDWQVNVTLDTTGASAFGALTAHLSNTYYPSASMNQNYAVLDEIGIVIDGDVVSAPQVLSAITGGKLQISGKFTPSAARLLAAQLQGPLPVVFQISSISNG
jgi:preprotein translocase subunit SecD